MINLGNETRLSSQRGAATVARRQFKSAQLAVLIDEWNASGRRILVGRGFEPEILRQVVAVEG
jgi:hypothetical protein